MHNVWLDPFFVILSKSWLAVDGKKLFSTCYIPYININRYKCSNYNGIQQVGRHFFNNEMDIMIER